MSDRPTYEELVEALRLTNVVLALAALRLGANDKASVDEIVRDNRDALARAKEQP